MLLAKPFDIILSALNVLDIVVMLSEYVNASMTNGTLYIVFSSVFTKIITF